MQSINVQAIGDAEAIVSRGAEILEGLKKQADQQKLETFEIADLTVGLECGGSDAFSGISANPAVGKVSDRLVQLGATVILAEVLEMIGTEEILAKRGVTPGIGEEISLRTGRYIHAAQSMGQDLIGTNPTPGNIRGGLSTIEEKSLGCVAKGGSTPIQEVVEYAQAPSKRGLVIMDTPGNDGESLTGLVAGGTQMILFTTGLGTPLGYPIVPVVKIASNSQTYRRMHSFIDLDAGQVVAGTSLDEMGDEIYRFILRVGRGDKTLSEKFPGSVVSINRVGPTF
jgi:altronate dehydratase large subunit